MTTSQPEDHQPAGPRECVALSCRVGIVSVERRVSSAGSWCTLIIHVNEAWSLKCHFQGGVSLTSYFTAKGMI